MMIAVDWGTTHLRAYRLDASGEIESRRSEPKGIMSVQSGDFAAALDGILAGWDEAADRLILMSGMIGSRQGWIDVPYMSCPARLRDLAGGVRSVAWAGRRAFICPGLACRDADGIPDVMRGEEVQIFGALSVTGRTGDVTLCLPGTHSKHAAIRGGAVESFVTHMTGEIFALLRDHSILGRSLAQCRADLDAFDDGLRRARQAGGLLHHIFGVRTRLLMGQADAASLAHYLSGILIGHELASAKMASPVLIVGASELAALYQRALAHEGVEASMIAADIATTRGLHALAQLIEKDGA
jgi:2-dehydro-3-deoxygalactonokinase